MKYLLVASLLGLLLHLVGAYPDPHAAEDLNNALEEGLEKTQEITVDGFLQQIDDQVATLQLTCENYAEHCIKSELTEFVGLCQRMYKTIVCDQKRDPGTVSEILSELNNALKKDKIREKESLKQLASSPA